MEVRTIPVSEQHPRVPNHRDQSPNDYRQQPHRGAHAHDFGRALVQVHNVRKVLLLHHQPQTVAWQIGDVALQEGAELTEGFSVHCW